MRKRYVKDYGTDYDVFENGVVWSYKSSKQIKPQLQKTKSGKSYIYVKLSKDGKVSKHYVHRLVAAAFIPNEEGKATVNHIDGDTENNGVSNLEWATSLEQTAHAWATGLVDTSGAKCVTSKLTSEDVVEIRRMKLEGIKQVGIAKKYGVGTSQISRILNSQSWHRKGG